MVLSSAMGRALSWVLGKLDKGYFFLGFGRQGVQFFEAGYGDLEKTIRLVQFRGELAKEMLGDPTKVPKPAVKVMEERAGQQAELEAANTSPELELVTGHFTSPMAYWLPAKSKQCEFHMLKPPAGVEIKGVCVMLPHTADQGKSVRRKLYGDALAKKGVACIILIAPFYGVRKPEEQKKWFLGEVDDFFLQAIAIALETACLLHWAKRTWGPHVPLATAGLSFGGGIAGLAAKMYSGPLAIVPYMGCLGPEEPYTEGVLKSSVAWEMLEDPAFAKDPRVPPPVLSGGSREDLSHLSSHEAAFCNYCRFVTDTKELKDALPVSSWGQSVLYMFQARDDDFVAFKEGKALYDTLLHLTEGSMDNTEGSASTNCSGTAALEVQSSELVTISGGHCTGFLKVSSIMPEAVLTALERLRVKHSM